MLLEILNNEKIDMLYNPLQIFSSICMPEKGLLPLKL